MRRFQKPFTGERYLLNLNTGEIHDLDAETPQCHIDEINPDHVYNCDSYMGAEIKAVIADHYNPNGCHYCNCSRDKG